MKSHQFLLYGANGYTGRLIARFAHLYGLSPILAGRSGEVLKVMAKQLNLPFKIIELDDEQALIAALQEVKVVLHAAGPFEHTARKMADACLKSGTHYLDINGDISVFEMLKAYHQQAVEAGIMIMPGVGFDVVPTDCVALLLKNKMPEAVKLELAFASTGGGLSHGTATTMATKLGEGGVARIDGKITKVRLGAKGMLVDFFRGTSQPAKKLFVMSIPWGDVSTAHTTTGIPNIETFTGISKKLYYVLKAQGLFNWLLRTSLVRNIAIKKIKALPAGPTDEQRKNAKSLVWGRVTAADGRAKIAKLCGPDGYTLTMYSALIIIQKVVAGNFQPGFQTPAKQYGPGIIEEVPGVEMMDDGEMGS